MYSVPAAKPSAHTVGIVRDGILVDVLLCCCCRHTDHGLPGDQALPGLQGDRHSESPASHSSQPIRVEHGEEGAAWSAMWQ
jgi:hypothetical protein